jgi:hypothetical protein
MRLRIDETVSCLLPVNGPMRLQGEVAMLIRPELRPLYSPHWRELSSQVRFVRAGGKCQRCGRPHLVHVRCLPDGRWFDEQAATWRDRRGRMARWPDLVEATRFRMTRVVLAAVHLDSDPTNNRLKNLRALCQRCHMLHDRSHHLAQRWITYRRRLADGDLFLGPYPASIAMSSSTYSTIQCEYTKPQKPVL